jgi:hypothetical protein
LITIGPTSMSIPILNLMSVSVKVTTMAAEMVPEDIDYSDAAAFTWTLK